MIKATISEGEGLVEALTSRANFLAAAYLKDRKQRLMRAPSRWRNPRLLWPQFDLEH